MNEFKQALSILFYVSYCNGFNNHVKIKEWMIYGKLVGVPVNNKENGCLILLKIENWKDLAYEEYNVLELKK